MNMSLRLKLSAMMFLQFMLCAVFFPQLAAYLTNIKVDGFMFSTILATMAWGALLSPIIGMLADRVMNAEKVLCLLNVFVAIMLFFAGTTQNHTLLFIYLLLAMAAYMPTWGLTSSIAMTNSTPEAFPGIRVFGSIGWVCAAVFALCGKHIFDTDIDGTNVPLYCASSVAIVAAVVAIVLPKTPPAAKGEPMSIIDALGLRAFSMFKDKNNAICILCSCAWMFAFVIYWLFFSKFLSEGMGIKDITLTMSIGQISEMAFLVVLPLAIKFIGLKWTMGLGLAAMVLRYVLCAYAPEQAGLDIVAIAIHGVIFGFFFVAAQMYIAKKAPSEIQNQAQGLFFCMVMGVSQIFGAYFTGWLLGEFTQDAGTAVVEAVKNTSTNVSLIDWKGLFFCEAAISLVIFVVFAIFFKDDTSKN